jgi:DNA-binding SARP family transcriptional activator
LDTGKYAEAISISHRALEQDLYDEAVYRCSMVAYSALNDRPAVARQFEKCKQLLKKDLNLEPSPQTIKLFNSLTQ